MQRATSIVRKAAVKIDRIAGIVVLAHEDRQRRRAVLKTVSGMEFLLDLEKATVLGDGDAVRLDDGNLIAVQAASQELLEIRAENPLRLMRVAWHIGNRHTPAEITEDALYIEDDHVLAEMIRGQGCSTTKVTRPFKPERGAYDHGGHDHGSHSHAHDHGAAGHHDHDHHDHGHHGHGDHHAKPNPPHGQPGHVHGPDCNHDHGHDHTHDVLNVGSNHHDHKHDHKHDHDHGHAHDHGHDHGHAPRAKHDH